MDKLQELENRILKLENENSKLISDYSRHQHDDIDGTNTLKKSINLDIDQYLQVGLATHSCAPVSKPGTTDEQYQYAMAVGPSDNRTGFVNKADIVQIDLLHRPKNEEHQSIFAARRNPVTCMKGVTVSTTTGQNTVTISGYNFTTDELAGALINIYDVDNIQVETQTIESNTSTVITIVDTWLASTSGGTFDIYTPVIHGAGFDIWRRTYVNEGTGGGVRFGVGPTEGGQNGLLYMDATGDLYWRPKTGAAVKLN